MSVGGLVAGVTVQGDEAHVSTVELACWKKRGPKLDLANATGVRVKHAGHPIHVGDILWWQGGRAFLSPLRFYHLPDEELVHGEHYDIELERTGYSHETPLPLGVDPALEAIAEERCAARSRAGSGDE